MGKTTAETIRDISRFHLEQNNGMLAGQCLSAVGWVGGTVPDTKIGLVELNTSEVSNTGIMVGAALMGRRPIYVIRYQGFMWLAANTLVNYAAKSKDVWGVPCPMFVRSIAMEGNGIGPTASSCQHGLIMRMPGIRVCAPMTPDEWTNCWHDFLEHDDPVYCSEHRRSFGIDYEFDDIIHDTADITIVAISAGRLNSIEAIDLLKKDNIVCNLIHQVKLKPFLISDKSLRAISNSKFVMVIDSDFEVCGASRSIAYELMHMTGKKVYALGLEDRSGGVAANLDNITPDPNKIYQFVKNLMNKD